MPAWDKYGPARAENVIDGLRKFGNTARKDYDVHPEKAKLLFENIQEALDAARAEYAPRIGEFSTPEPNFEPKSPESVKNEPVSTVPTPRQGVPDPVLPHWSKIRTFVDSIPDKQFPAYALLISNRMVDKAVGRDIGAGLDLDKLYGPESAPKRRMIQTADVGDE